MKKIVSILLTLVILLSVAAFAEAADFTGLWYGSLFGMNIELTINEDGTYVLAAPGAPGDEESGSTGAWEFDGEKIIMDGDESSPLVYDGETLVMSDGEMEVIFTREPGDSFVAAEAIADAPVEAFAGEWTCKYVTMAGLTIDADAVGEVLGVKIEGTSVTVADDSGMFGDGEAQEFTYADGALTFGEDGVGAITIQALEDGMLAMTMSLGENEEGESESFIFYLIPAEAAEVEDAA